MNVFGLDPLAWNLCKLTWFAMYTGMAVGGCIGFMYSRIFRR